MANEFTIDNFGTLIKYSGKGGTVNVPPSVKVIGARAFSGSAVTSVYVPSGVNEIRDEAFCGCDMLVRVNIGEGCKRIGRNAFLCNTKTTRVFTISSMLESIGECAFLGKEWKDNFDLPIDAPCITVYTQKAQAVISHFAHYMNAHLIISPTEEYKKAKFDEWQRNKRREAEEELWEAKQRRAYAESRLAGIHREIDQTTEKLKELKGPKGLFKKGERVRAEAHLTLTERQIPSAEKALNTALGHIERLEKEKIARDTASREDLWRKFEIECGKQLTREVSTLISCERAKIKAALSEKNMGSRGTSGAQTGYAAITTVSPLYEETFGGTESTWVGGEHGPLATATNQGMPYHPDNGETLPIYDTDTLGTQSDTDSIAVIDISDM